MGIVQKANKCPPQKDSFWMKRAYRLALLAEAEGEVPVGAVLVGGDQQVLGEGWNQVIHKHDPTAHAEIIALRTAAALLGNYRLSKTTLYVTLEPCPMCASAMVHARIQRLVFATRDFKTGSAGSVCNLLSGDPLNHQVQIDEGPMQVACAELLETFFKRRRQNMR